MFIWNLAEADPNSQRVKQVETPAQKLKKDLLLNNVQVNSRNGKELLISHRFKSAYLVNMETD